MTYRVELAAQLKGLARAPARRDLRADRQVAREHEQVLDVAVRQLQPGEGGGSHGF